MALNATNAFQYEEDWAQRLRERLNETSVWKEVCKVLYTDTYTFNLPYLADISLQSVTRSSPYTAQAIIQSNETLVIDQQRLAPMVIPQADYFQSRYSDFMQLAERQAAQLDAQVETYVWGAAQTTTFENFDDGSIGGSAGTSITVSISNIDDIIANVKRVIFTARGAEQLGRNGGFVLWDPTRFALVEQWAMANGFGFADEVLRNGVRFGFRAGGLSHYVSTQLPSGRNVAGVKGIYHVGILKSTYGVPKFLKEDPGQIYGFGVVSAVNYGVLLPVQHQSLMMDIAIVQ